MTLRTVGVYCRHCGGTGIYVGTCERTGAAVVCSSCKGSGCLIHTFEEFEGRRRRRGVARVFAYTGGIPVRPEDGGTDYEQWLAGAPALPFPEPRDIRCPAWWYQNTDNRRSPKWDECECSKFKDCSRFPEKEKCWERFDKEGL